MSPILVPKSMQQFITFVRYYETGGIILDTINYDYVLLYLIKYPYFLWT